METFYVHLPFADVNVFVPALILIGFAVGIISSFFGIGGAWMVTPGLNILGFPMTYAIGTDITHVAGKAVFATRQHAKMGNVDYKLAWVMVLGTIAGVELGAQLIMFLKKLNLVDTSVRWAYAVLLFFISVVVFVDWYKSKKKKIKESGIELYKSLHQIKIPPIVHFEVANVTCLVSD